MKLRVEYRKLAPGWRWLMYDGDALMPIMGSVRFFRTKFFCRRDFKKRYVMLQKKRQYWPKYRDVD